MTKGKRQMTDGIQMAICDTQVKSFRISASNLELRTSIRHKTLYRKLLFDKSNQRIFYLRMSWNRRLSSVSWICINVMLAAVPLQITTAFNEVFYQRTSLQSSTPTSVHFEPVCLSAVSYPSSIIR